MFILEKIKMGSLKSFIVSLIYNSRRTSTHELQNNLALGYNLYLEILDMLYKNKQRKISQKVTEFIIKLQ